MKPDKIRKGSFIVVMALAAVIALSAAWPCPATAAGPMECSLIGTWYGTAGPLTWLGVHTAGSTKLRGNMVLNWVDGRYFGVDVGNYPTPGHGVWERTGRGKYKYTWYA